ncbi:MAG: hypothetical protein BGO10_05760 [Chlamydia sp. 32-24]|nr:MAG: hypothetical protein BGO10_05760 [Chlamydia sp. 32-24]
MNFLSQLPQEIIERFIIDPLPNTHIFAVSKSLSNKIYSNFEINFLSKNCSSSRKELFYCYLFKRYIDQSFTITTTTKENLKNKFVKFSIRHSFTELIYLLMKKGLFPLDYLKKAVLISIEKNHYLFFKKVFFKYENTKKYAAAIEKFVENIFEYDRLSILIFLLKNFKTLKLREAAQNNALSQGCFWGSLETIKYVLEKTSLIKKNLNCSNPFLQAVLGRQVETVKYLLSSKEYNFSPSCYSNALIREAVKNGCTEIVKILLEDSRVDPGANHQECLLLAVRDGATAIVELLLKNAHVSPSVDGNLPLKIAAKVGHKEIVVLLLRDRRVNPATQKNYPLRMSAFHNHYKIVKILLESSKVNPYDCKNEAFRHAKKHNFYKVQHYLCRWQIKQAVRADHVKDLKRAITSHLLPLKKVKKICYMEATLYDRKNVLNFLRSSSLFN